MRGVGKRARGFSEYEAPSDWAETRGSFVDGLGSAHGDSVHESKVLLFDSSGTPVRYANHRVGFVVREDA